jgi:hypothetical protein
MVKLRVTACDVCQDIARPTRQYRVQRDDKQAVTVDLCHTHAKPFEVFLAKVTVKDGDQEPQAPEPPPKAARRRAGTVRRSTLEEIEESKRNRENK